MIALKKLYGDELLRLALMLSLLRADPEQYLRSEEARLLAGGLVNGTERSPEISEYYHRSRTLHPKSIDSLLLDYERDIFEEMMSLGRWGGNTRSNNEAVQAYLLNGVESANSQQAVAAIAQSSVAQDLYSHLPVVQLDDAEVEQCVTIKTENDTSEEDLYEEVVCLSPDAGVEQEIEIKTEEPDDVASNFHTHLSFIRNLSTFEGPLLEEDSGASASFDVSQFFSDPSPIRKFASDVSKSLPLFYDENAIDDYMPFYMQNGGGDTIRDQNLADLRDFNENRETLEEFKRQIENDDIKEEQDEDYDRYLLQNTELDRDFEPVPFVKRERASTSFTSVASSSGVSEAEACASGSSSSNESSFFGSHRFKIEKDEGLYSGDELTPEDMDLIEVLWKQDVDMGFCLNDTQNQGDVKCPIDPDCKTKLEDDNAIEKLKTALEDEVKNIDTKKLDSPINDPWDGLSYTVDTETGEYVLSGDLPERFDLLDEALQLVDLEDARTNLHGELKDETTSDRPKQEEDPKLELQSAEPEMLAPRYHPHAVAEHHALPPPPSDQQQHHAHAVHHHFAAAYHHQNLVRSVSMEQRWQDLAALLALPGPNAPAAALAAPDHHPHHPHPHPHPHHLYNQHHHQLGHCSQGSSPYVSSPYAPISEKPPLGPPADIYGSPNLGSAVAASMNVSHGPSGCTASGGGPPPFYKAEHPQHEHHQPDPMYYQNGTNELNGTSDGFLSSILNDEDLQLMDMAMNEGMYTMRMLESGGAAAAAGGGPPVHLPHQTQPTHSMSNHHINMGSERIDASSDSAVSSMGSERVPSLSDGEWCDAGSDSAQDFHSKLRPCENESRQPPLVAQKKHHMFGKRCFQDQTSLGRLRNSAHEEHPMSDVKFEYDQPSAPSTAYIPDVGHMAPEMKYSCTMEFTAGGAGVGLSPVAGGLRHNHTYSLPPGPPQPPHRPLARDKRGRRGLEASGLTACGSQGPLSRDEKKARALGIPMTVHDIINLPMDEFNERLSKHDLSETQLSLIRDIRRRGKNKVAAQNCRKRKLDQITSLADEVRDARLRKQRLQRDRHSLLAQRQRAKEHFAALYRHVFQHLRDSEGNPLSSQQYSLQQAADGAVVLVPRASASLLPDSRSPRSVDRHMSSNGTSDDDLDRIKIKQRKSFDQ